MKTSFKKNNSEISEQNKENQVPEILSTNSERIAKVIARAGLCSRREAERWIINGQVKLNNKVLTECGVNVTSKDIIEVNGQPLPSQTITKLWLYHKQRGYLVTNNDPEGRLTIFEDLKSKIDTRLISVGRLDMDSEGLLLLTNDGDLARKLELLYEGVPGLLLVATACQKEVIVLLSAEVSTSPSSLYLLTPPDIPNVIVVL